jgi:hypothetical protein
MKIRVLQPERRAAAVVEHGGRSGWWGACLGAIGGGWGMTAVGHRGGQRAAGGPVVVRRGAGGVA